MSMPEDAGGTALYRRIRSDIEEKIVSGAWPPGHRVPFEHELTTTYGCSRMTVNKVLSALAEEGMIERRRRAGSFVAQPRVQSAVLEIPDLKAEVEARGEVYGYELLDKQRRRATKSDRDHLGIASGPVMALTCRHFAQGQSLALESRLLNLSAVPEAEAQDFAKTPPGTWLLGHVPWTEAEHQILACNASEDDAAALGIAPQTACLVVERRTWRGGEPITFVHLTFPADRYRLVARFAPANRRGLGGAGAPKTRRR